MATLQKMMITQMMIFLPNIVSVIGDARAIEKRS